MKSISDFGVERLQTWGLDRVYRYPGDRINGVVGVVIRNVGDYARPSTSEM